MDALKLARQRTEGAPIGLDPLLEALIGHLPKAGSDWPGEQRQAWLKMASMAFDVVYGPAESRVFSGGAGGSMAAADLPLIGEVDFDTGGATIASGKERSKRVQQQADHMTYDYYVDKEGYARRSSSDERVMPSDIPVDAEIYDVRRGTQRNRETVIWSDDSMGVRSQHAFVGPG